LVGLLSFGFFCYNWFINEQFENNMTLQIFNKRADNIRPYNPLNVGADIIRPNF